MNEQKHSEKNDDEPADVVDYTTIIGLRWIDKHGNQWMIDTEGIPIRQNIVTTNHDDEKQQQSEYQVNEVIAITDSIDLYFVVIIHSDTV